MKHHSLLILNKKGKGVGKWENKRFVNKDSKKVSTLKLCLNELS